MSPILIRPHLARRPVAGPAWRRVAAWLLRRASDALARRAREVARPLHAQRRRGQHDVTVEFHADAGAPEGALYVDGEFIGYVDARRL